MKFLKSIVSLVLCIAIMATTAVFAFAEGEFQPYDPALKPVITQQPHDITLKKSIYSFPVPTDLKVSISSSPFSVGYQLYRVGSKDELVSDSKNSNISSSLKAGEYYFIVYNTNCSENTEYYVKSDTFKVEVQRPTLKEILGVTIFETSFVNYILFLVTFGPIIRLFNSIFKTA